MGHWRGQRGTWAWWEIQRRLIVRQIFPFLLFSAPQSISDAWLTGLTGTGHPALTIPVGFVPAHDNEQIRLPVGLQIVGRKFGDIDCLKVGAAWERAFDWKALEGGK